MTLVAGISDQHAGIASSMFNAGQQVGGAVGLAVIGSVAWTIVNNHVRSTIAASQPGIPPPPGVPPCRAAPSTTTP